MMRTTTQAATVAGVLAAMAGSALADGERLFFEISTDTISPDRPSAVVTLWAGFDARDYAVAGVATSVRASEGSWFALHLPPPLAGPGTSPGRPADGGRAVEGIIAGQLNFPTAGIFADPSNPIAVWRGEIEVFDFTPREIDLSTITSRFDVYFARDASGSLSRLPTLTEASVTIAVVPAPGSLAVLAIGLVAGRRRRAV